MDTPAHRAFKDQLYDQFARIGKALASPHRLELLDLLAQGERSVEDVARETGMSVANASQHLQTLRAAQLVTARRDGIHAFYRLADGQVFRLWQAVRDVGAVRLAEIDRLAIAFLGDRSTLEPVEAAELLERLRQGDVVLLDVRPEEEYRAGHLPGARSVPLATLDAQASQLPRDREIVAYCRGPYCLFSDEAVALLRARGYAARRLAIGFPDWRAAGLPVAA
ncbi:MAG TPA: metalloregulator ArsR/SmtB family transcription factor [Chloroflexota bacterium]|jgi:rhodanese-related sulfurtransferase/biotin operon repressor